VYPWSAGKDYPRAQWIQRTYLWNVLWLLALCARGDE
jgi:hypothetical protein